MNIFERIKKAVTNITQGAGIGREYRNVFEIEGVPAYSQFYNTGVSVWKYLYRGVYKPWHVVPAPTIGKPHGKRELYRLDLAKASAAELASLVWAEQCGVSANAKGFTPSENKLTDDLGDFILHVLDENGFTSKMRELIESAAALGGAAMKVWYDERRDAEGNPIPDSGHIRIGYSMADQFVPLAWNNAEVTEGIFISRTAKWGWYYTRLEWHIWDGTVYKIKNELYKASKTDSSGNDQDILGVRCPLAEIYPLLAEEVEISCAKKSLFTYFRMPAANNLDDNSPLGISIYANALSTLHAIDICYDSLVREFRLGRKRIIVPAASIRTITDPQTGEQRRYFDDSDEVYEALSTDDPDVLKVQDTSVELRIEEHISALNALLSIYAMQIGVSPGTFSFSESEGLKTATEVVSENSKTYKTVCTVQNMIRPSINHLVDDIIAVASLYGVKWKGRTISDLAASGYEVSVTFDDSIIQDRQTNVSEGLLLVNSGLLSKFTFLTDRKYGQCLTPEQAKAELQRIADESRVDTGVLERMNAVFGD